MAGSGSNHCEVHMGESAFKETYTPTTTSEIPEMGTACLINEAKKTKNKLIEIEMISLFLKSLS